MYYYAFYHIDEEMFIDRGGYWSVSPLSITEENCLYRQLNLPQVIEKATGERFEDVYKNIILIGIRDDESSVDFENDTIWEGEVFETELDARLTLRQDIKEQLPNKGLKGFPVTTTGTGGFYILTNTSSSS